MDPYRGRWGKRRVRNRLDDLLANLDPLEFERVMAGYYRKHGFEVEECGTGGTGLGFDGGIDLKLRRDGEYVLVQCKRHNVYQLTHNPVHELLGVTGTEGADRCILVNTGEFTAYAWEVAAKNPKLELIDGEQLRQMLPELARPVEPVATPPDVERGGLYRRAPRSGREGYSLPVLNAKPPPFRATEQDGRRKLYSDMIPAVWVTGAILFVLLIVIRQCSDSSSHVTRTVPVQRDVPVAKPQLTVPQATVGAGAVHRSEKVEPPRSIARRYTREELQEQQRRADEAMKIIEATTPGM